MINNTASTKYRFYLKRIVESYKKKDKNIHDKIKDAAKFLRYGCEICEKEPPNHLGGTICSKCYQAEKRKKTEGGS